MGLKKSDGREVEQGEENVNKTAGNVNSSRCLGGDLDKKEVGDGNVIILRENIVDSMEKGKDAMNNNNVNDKQVPRFEYKGITYLDYTKIPKAHLYTYDTRNFTKYLVDELVQNHSIIKLIFKDSICDPRIISFIRLFTKINNVFGLSAITFTDNLIEARIANNVFQHNR
jgi:hypothetical protein